MKFTTIILDIIRIFCYIIRSKSREKIVATKLDKIDKKILNILQENGRITNSQLATDVGLSPPPMLERVKKLEKNGIITKYVAILDSKKIDKSTIVIVSLSLARHRIKSIDQVTHELSKFPEILECYHIAGEEDYLLKVVVKDVHEYEEFILKKLAQISAIEKIKSHIVLSSLKSDTKILIE